MINLSDRIKEHGYSASLGVKPYQVHDKPIRQNKGTLATVQALVLSPLRFMINLSDRIKEHGYSASLGVKPYQVHDKPIRQNKGTLATVQALVLSPLRLMVDLSGRIKESRALAKKNNVHSDTGIEQIKFIRTIKIPLLVPFSKLMSFPHKAL